MVNDNLGRRSSRAKSTPLDFNDACLKKAGSGAMAKIDALLTSLEPQFNGYSCSAASMTTVINAIRRIAVGGAALEPLAQSEILSQVELHHWRERVSDEGYRGMHGMPLLEFGEVVREALTVFRIPMRRVDAIEIHPGMVDLEGPREELRRAVEIVAESPNDFLIAHFTQGEYFGNWYGGHISPVGTYDPRKDRVLVLDVDPECEAPYWVSFNRFFEGLVGRSKVIGSRGGGYVWIKLERL